MPTQRLPRKAQVARFRQELGDFIKTYGDSRELASVVDALRQAEKGFDGAAGESRESPGERVAREARESASDRGRAIADEAGAGRSPRRNTPFNQRQERALAAQTEGGSNATD